MTIDAYKLSQRFLSNNTIKIFDKNLHWYNGKYYEKISDEQLKHTVYNFLTEDEKKQVKCNDIKQVIYHIKMQPSIESLEYPANEQYICCQNGVVDVYNMKLLPHSPEYNCTYMINARYTQTPTNNGVYNNFMQSLFAVDENLFEINENENIQSLEEWLGYFISDCTRAKKMAIIYGKPNTGKSVLLALVEYLLGKSNVSNVNIKQVNDEFYLAHLCENRANICYDTKNIKLNDIGNIKQLTSPDDSITVRKPHCTPYSTKRKTKIMFACNTLPELDLNSDERKAYFVRVMLFHFNNIISKKDQNPNLIYELISEKDYIFGRLLTAYNKFLQREYKFLISNDMKLTRKQYQDRYEIVKKFVKKHIKKKTKAKISCKDLTNKLEKFVQSHGLHYEPKYKTELFKILKDNDIEHKKVKIKGKSIMGFYGAKLK